MIRRVVFLPPAVVDTLEAASWYERQAPLLGRVFLAEVNQQVGRVARFPESYPLVRTNCRRANLHRFPYAIVYRLLPAAIEVIAVFHCSADPASAHRRAHFSFDQ